METKENKAKRQQKRAELSAQYRREKEDGKRKAEHYKLVEKQAKEAKKSPHEAKKRYFLSCVGLNKIYSNRVQAVYDFNLDVKEGEFIVLVGPSGCGKSTTLRMIAGLEDITLGDLFIDGKHANELEPKQRGVAMVFQSYALYPHLTVFENLAFGLRGSKITAPKTALDPLDKERIHREFEERISLLKAGLSSASKEEKASWREKIREAKLNRLIAYERARKPEGGENALETRPLRRGEIAERIRKAAEALQITPYLYRRPTQLSGGQCQRVALGRAMVRNAKVFLLDEPLSNLDAKLRVQMRSELVKLHESLGTTMVYVTHDQTEAMTMADRIVVMKDGLIQQIGTPLEVYQRPANVFVATFIGSPTMNIREGTIEGGSLKAEGFSYPLGQEEKTSIVSFYEGKRSQIEKALNEPALTQKEESLLKEEAGRVASILSGSSFAVKFGIRPEDILVGDGGGECYPEMTIECKVSELLGAEYYLHFDYLGSEMVAKVPNKTPIAHGSVLPVSFKKSGLRLFDADTEERIS